MDTDNEFPYKKGYFSKDPSKFSYYALMSSQWLLTHELVLQNDLKPEIIVDNWQYA